MFSCHSAATAKSQCIVEGAFGSDAAGESAMRLAGTTDYFRVPHVTGGNEPWPHCGRRCRTRSTWRKVARINLIDEDVHVIVIGSATFVRSGKLCRRLSFCVKCVHLTNRWENMHKSRVSTNLGSSLCIACDGVSYACGAQCAQRLSSSQGESHHQVCVPWRKCHWGRWCSCTRNRHKGVACDVCFPWNMTSILATRAEQCFATDMIAHETGTASSSQCQTCCVARNFGHRMAKWWNIRSDGVCVVCHGIVFATLITCEV